MIWIAAAIIWAATAWLAVTILGRVSSDRYREWYLTGRADEDELRELVDQILDLEGNDALEILGQIIAQQISERFPRGPVVTVNLNGDEVEAWDGIDRLTFYAEK